MMTINSELLRFIKFITQAMSPDDPDVNQTRTRHWQSVGRFVLAFALVEENLQAALRKTAEVTPEVARAIFSGTRVDTASSYIKRIAEAQQWPKDRLEDIDYIFKQLGEITRVRNDLLHYGVIPEKEGGWTTSNELVAHIPARSRETEVSPQHLESMADDCMNIVLHLIVNIESDDATRQEILQKSAAVLARAWRYKPEKRSGAEGSILSFPQ
jgi:hypothetical protein